MELHVSEAHKTDSLKTRPTHHKLLLLLQRTTAVSHYLQSSRTYRPEKCPNLTDVTAITSVRHAPPLAVDLPVLQARDAGGPVALRTPRRAFHALPVSRVCVVMCRAVFHAPTIVPEPPVAAGYALRAVGAAAALAGLVTRSAAGKSGKVSVESGEKSGEFSAASGLIGT